MTVDQITSIKKDQIQTLVLLSDRSHLIIDYRPLKLKLYVPLGIDRIQRNLRVVNTIKNHIVDKIHHKRRPWTNHQVTIFRS